MILHDESPRLKPLNQPFVLGPFSTEWDHWCEHRLDIIDKKFGPLPQMTPIAHTHWWQWDRQMVDETLQAHSVVRLCDGALHDHVQMLFDACRATGEPRVIISDTQLPHPHPDNVRVIVTQPMAYQFSRTFADSGVRPVYQRRVSDLDHPFMIMCQSADHGRHVLMLVLEQLSLLRDALYSVGDVQAHEILFAADALGLNPCLRDMPGRLLAGGQVKFDVGRNLDLLPDLINRCHFYVSVDTNGLHTREILPCVTEKALWGYTTTVPTLPIWGECVARQMRAWGFRFQNIQHRLPGETAQDAVIRWCKEILFHHQITQNQQWSQRWQDSQGETTIHNFELTRGLHHVILQHTERQIAELPPEFQNLNQLDDDKK